ELGNPEPGRAAVLCEQPRLGRRLRHRPGGPEGGRPDQGGQVPPADGGGGGEREIVTTRREFVRGAARVLGSGGLLGTAAPLLSACARSPTDTGPAPALAPLDVGDLTADGQWRVAPAAGPGGAQILVVRDAVDRFHAVSMRCTHEGCPVNPPAAGIITC